MSKTQQILLTRQQAADLCHITTITLKRAEKDGELKA